MSTSRRALIKGAALSGLLAGTGGLAACERKTEQPSTPAVAAEPPVREPVKLDSKIIADAEKVNALAFTPAERAMMLEGLEAGLETLAKIRAVALGNNEAPALVFDPKLPRAKIKSQKNILTLAGNYSAPLPKEDADIAFASVAQQSAWLHARAISSAALTEIYLKRIARHDAKLSAFITVTADLARAQAAQADEEFAKGRDRGPLPGLPLSF